MYYTKNKKIAFVVKKITKTRILVEMNQNTIYKMEYEKIFS